jgi:hypothetical protein
MISFKEFLVEGGLATASYNTTRANKKDILIAVKLVAKALGINENELKDDVLGSSRITMLGKKKDSGDVDIAYKLKDNESEEDVDKKMRQAFSGEGKLNKGLRVGSYAVPVGGDKKIQVDILFVDNKDWAKWIFHTDEDSKYNSSIRNELILAALAYSQKPGSEFVLRDADGKPYARASYSIRFGDGMKKLFKSAKYNEKNKRFNKSMQTVTPAELEKTLKDHNIDAKFSNDDIIINDPDAVANYIFGDKVKAKDLMTAEDVIKQINLLKNSKEILDHAKRQMIKRKFPIPDEIK